MIGHRFVSATHAPDVDGNVDPDQWMAGAVCAQIGGDEWFPDKGCSTRDAKAVCNGVGDKPGCPVKAQCLTYALDHNERYGVWGGLSERERRRLPRTRQPRVMQPCGTPAAYRRHFRNSEPPCPECVRAEQLASRERADRQRAGDAA